MNIQSVVLLFSLKPYWKSFKWDEFSVNLTNLLFKIIEKSLAKTLIIVMPL